MFSDFQVDRPFGFFGGLLFFLVAASCFLSVKSWVEVPISRALANEMANKRVDWSLLKLTKEQAEASMKQMEAEQNTYITIEAIGAVFWIIGFLAAAIRSLWSPRLLLLGGPFKIWGNLYIKDTMLIGFDIAIFVLALMLWRRWERDSSTSESR